MPLHPARMIGSEELDWMTVRQILSQAPALEDNRTRQFWYHFAPVLLH